MTEEWFDICQASTTEHSEILLQTTDFSSSFINIVSTTSGTANSFVIWGFLRQSLGLWATSSQQDLLESLLLQDLLLSASWPLYSMSCASYFSETPRNPPWSFTGCLSLAVLSPTASTPTSFSSIAARRCAPQPPSQSSTYQTS